MHLIRSSKPAVEKPFIRTRRSYEVPHYRLERGKRYINGKFVGICGPKNKVNGVEQKALREAEAKARKMPSPVEELPFDFDSFTLLPGRVLLKRPPQITQIGGIDLPPENYASEPFFYVVKVAPNVTCCQPGDRVIFGKNHNPKQVRCGRPLHIARESGIAAVYLARRISIAQILR